MSVSPVPFSDNVAAYLLLVSRPDSNDAYYRGLLSLRLGRDHLLDDEIAENLAADFSFQTLCRLFATGRAEQRRVLATWKMLNPLSSDPQVGDESLQQALWTALVADPRFDPIWKNTLEELKYAQPFAQGSTLSALLKLLARVTRAPGIASLPLATPALAAMTGLIVGSGGVQVYHWLAVLITDC